MTAQTVAQAFENAAASWPQRDFLHVMPGAGEAYGIEAGAISYEAARARVDQIAARLADAGAARGMRLMLLLENRPDFFLWWLAANRLGLSVVPINPDLRQAEIRHMAQVTSPALAVAIAARVDDLRSAMPDIAVITPDSDIPALRAAPAFDDPPGLSHEAAVLFTSGSTGRPKGCVLTNEYFLRAGAWYRDEGGLCALGTDGERMLTPLPVFHMNAMAYSFMAMIAVGGCLIALDRFHPRSWWQDVAQSGATCLHYLGVIPSILMSLPEAPEERAHQVRFGFGAGVDPKLHAAFEARFGFPLIEAWAMTETGAGAVIAASQLPRVVGESALGRPGDAMELRLVDEDGAEAAQGELLVRASGDDPKSGFFREYLGDLAATSEAWAGGWFHTGDIVRRADDGQLHFVDRKKNVIRRSGENIAAFEVESILARHPAVGAIGVAAAPDPLRGDEVFALIVPAEGVLPGQETATEIARWALGQMAYYKVPGHIGFTDNLPLTATNKIQRAELKSRAAELVGKDGTFDLRHLKKRSA